MAPKSLLAGPSRTWWRSHMKGFSRTNVYNMRAFAAAWNGPEPIVETPSGQLSWSHNVARLFVGSGEAHVTISTTFGRGPLSLR
jgi:hypothetical protein